MGREAGDFEKRFGMMIKVRRAEQDGPAEVRIESEDDRPSRELLKSTESE